MKEEKGINEGRERIEGIIGERFDMNEVLSPSEDTSEMSGGG